jgi:DNA-binding LytR/AlgR family response regulator
LSKFSVLIVEDLQLASAALARILGAHADVGEIKTARTLACGRNQLIKIQFDIVFLDVKLPDGSGVTLGEELTDRHRNSALVYLTASPDAAVSAFRQGAVDYLLKPVTSVNVERAMARIRERKAGTHPSVLQVREGSATRYIPIQSISAVESAGHYQCVHADGEVYLIREPIIALMHRLGSGFVRVHRSIVVRADLIESVRSRRNGDGELSLRGGKTVRLSRSYRGELEAAMASR